MSLSPRSVPGANPPGVGGVLGNYKTLPQLALALGPYFLPSSYAIAPSATTSGNRVTAITNEQLQVTFTAFLDGLATWNYPASYNAPPGVVAIPIGPPPSAGTTWYLLDPGPTRDGVSIQSTDSTDARPLIIVAIGNPN